MKKIAGLIVSFRWAIMAFILALAAVCAVLAMSVEINTDMTQYLPDDSNMRTGIDLMDSEFPDLEESHTIRVMFTGMPEGEKQETAERLKAIANVEGVSFEPGDPDYDRDGHTLYVIATEHDFDTPEQLAIEAALKADFADYGMVFERDATGTPDLELWVLLLAIALMMAIMFIMCASWVEPFLFMITIGAAVLINLGTNLFLGSISEVTYSIAAILQLILSMDYSIILLGFYRQELAHNQDRLSAMKNAIVSATASVSSSAMTTVVGLLVLVFMRFKIGKDLGIVLAKGVFLSMFCVFTLLPALILAFDKLIRLTAKKAPHIKAGGLAALSYRFRHVIAVLLVALFFGSYVLQQNTEIAYSLAEPDPIAEVFSPVNTVLVLFDNQDEETVAEIAEGLEANGHVKSVAAASTTIGKPYTSAELVAEIEELQAETDAEPEFELDAEMLDILYYYKYMQGRTGALAAGDFIKFIADDVAENGSFEEYIDAETRDNLDLMETFSEKSSLTAPKTAAELAEIFEMPQEDIADLFVYYYGEHGGAETGTMTLPQFVAFLRGDVLADPEFGNLIDDETRDMIGTLETLTSRAEITAPKRAGEAADTLEMAQDDIDLLYMVYFAKHGATDAHTLTFPAFARLVADEVLKDSRFGNMIDDTMRKDIGKLSFLAEPKRFQAAENSAVIADTLGMDIGQARLLYMFYFAEHGAVDARRMTIPQFTSLLADDMLNDSRFDDAFAEGDRDQIKILRAFGEKERFEANYTAPQFAHLMGLDRDMAEFLYASYYAAAGEVEPEPMAPRAFVDFLLNDIAKNRNFSGMFTAEQKAGLKQFLAMLDMPPNPYFPLPDPDEPLPASYMASIVQMDPQTVSSIYIYRMLSKEKYRGPGAPLGDVVTFMDSTVAATGLGGGETGELYPLLNLMNAVKEDKAATYTPDELAEMIGMEPETLKLVYAYRMDQVNNTSGWKVSLETLVDFVLTDLAEGDYADSVNEEDLEDLKLAKTLMAAAKNGTPYTAAALAGLVDMDAETLRMLYAYDIAERGDTSGWALSLMQLVDYILSDLAADDDFGDTFSAENIRDLERLKAIMAGAYAGTGYGPESLASLFEIDSDMAQKLYLLRKSRLGEAAGWALSIEGFIRFINEEVLTDPDLADNVSADDADMLDAAERLTAAVIAGGTYDYKAMAALLEGFSDGLDEDSLRLLYVYYFSLVDSDPAWTFSIMELFDYLTGEILQDPLFDEFFDSETRQTLLDTKADLDEGVLQLTGPKFSRMVITTTYPGESAETYAFLGGLIQDFREDLKGSYYIVGDSAMHYEMSQSFGGELTLITWLTIVSIFIVVALTFRSLTIPAILVIIIQCGVYMTVSTIGFQGYSIYFLAFLIVECILMGSTIDYGILFTNYYVEKRKAMGPKEALAAAYEGSLHTILTSGSIMILAAGVVGRFFGNETVRQICETISKGAVCACLLIVFILPGVLALCDRFVVKK